MLFQITETNPVIEKAPKPGIFLLQIKSSTEKTPQNETRYQRSGPLL